jgi:hypothetical protein
MIDLDSLKKLDAQYTQGLAKADHDFVAGRTDKRTFFRATKSLFDKYRSESRKYLRR